MPISQRMHLNKLERRRIQNKNNIVSLDNLPSGQVKFLKQEGQDAMTCDPVYLNFNDDVEGNNPKRVHFNTVLKPNRDDISNLNVYSKTFTQ